LMSETRMVAAVTPAKGSGLQVPLLQRGHRRAGTAIAGAIVVVVLAALELATSRPVVDVHFHQQFIPVPVGLALISAVLALRTYAYGGSQRTLAYGLGFLGFATVYVWHGVFTSLESPFRYLAYGPIARVVLAACLLWGVTSKVDAPEWRPGRLGVGIAGCLALGGLAFAANPLLEAFANSNPASTVQLARIILETSALALGVAAIIPLLRRTDVPATPLIPFGLALNAGQSVLFLAAAPWELTWWTAHALGGAGMALLAWAVVVVEREELRAEEARRWRQIAGLQADFINAAAHQLRTPLTPVLLAVRSMETRASQDPQLHRQVMMLERNLQRLAETVGDLVDASLLAEGTKSVRQPVDLRESLQEACSKVATERGADCALRDVGEPVMVSAHPRMLRYLLAALLRTPNSLGPPTLAVDAGDAVVEVSRRPEEGPESDLRLHLARSMAEREGMTIDLQIPDRIQLRMPLLARVTAKR
jgi:signal transduction histidine kinase